MLFVLVIAVAIWGVARVMGVPPQVRWILLGLLYVAVIGLQVVFPDGHPLRTATGGTPVPWLILGGIALLVVGYRAILLRLRARADLAGADRAAPAPTGPFSDDELERYARHITLREIGGTGQRKLKAAKVLVVGAGGLGSPILLYLAAAGVGTIGIIDGDTVSLSNLQRQVIHTDARQGMAKVFSAQIAIGALNPFVTVKPYNRALTSEIAAELFADYDLIIDGTDNFATRALINAAAVQAAKPLLAGAISAWEGQVSLYDPARGVPCMACVFPQAPAPEMSATCSETGVIGALPGIIGTMMALEAIKEITGAGEGLRGRMLIHDALHGESRSIRIKRREDCPVCGTV